MGLWDDFTSAVGDVGGALKSGNVTPWDIYNYTEQAGGMRDRRSAAEADHRRRLAEHGGRIDELENLGRETMPGMLKDRQRDIAQHYGTQGRRALQNAAGRGLLHSGATQAYMRDIGGQHQQASTTATNQANQQLAHLLMQTEGMRAQLGRDEMSLDMMPIIQWDEQNAANQQALMQIMKMGGNLAGAYLGGPAYAASLAPQVMQPQAPSPYANPGGMSYPRIRGRNPPSWMTQGYGSGNPSNDYPY